MFCLDGPRTPFLSLLTSSITNLGIIVGIITENLNTGTHMMLKYKHLQRWYIGPVKTGRWSGQDWLVHFKSSIIKIVIVRSYVHIQYHKSEYKTPFSGSTSVASMPWSLKPSAGSAVSMSQHLIGQGSALKQMESSLTFLLPHSTNSRSVYWLF